MTAPDAPNLESYFEYFSEIEECFRRCRGTPTLLSTLDWALIESWKEAGIPLGAVLAGIERAFEKFKKRPKRFQSVNSLAYCLQSVMEAAEEMAAATAGEERRPAPETKHEEPPIPLERLHAYFGENATALRSASARIAAEATDPSSRVLADDLAAIASELNKISGDLKQAPNDLQGLENEMAALEEKLQASVLRGCPHQLMVEIRGKTQRSMAPYRGKMTGPQIESLERQMLKHALFEHYRLPRLSLFYCAP